jgi:hypothetical protein
MLLVENVYFLECTTIFLPHETCICILLNIRHFEASYDSYIKFSEMGNSIIGIWWATKVQSSVEARAFLRMAELYGKLNSLQTRSRLSLKS